MSFILVTQITNLLALGNVLNRQPWILRGSFSLGNCNALFWRRERVMDLRICKLVVLHKPRQHLFIVLTIIWWLYLFHAFKLCDKSKLFCTRWSEVHDGSCEKGKSIHVLAFNLCYSRCCALECTGITSALRGRVSQFAVPLLLVLILFCDFWSGSHFCMISLESLQQLVDGCCQRYCRAQ